MRDIQSSTARVMSDAGVLKHYHASHPEVADNAIKKLVAWYGGEGDGN